MGRELGGDVGEYHSSLVIIGGIANCAGLSYNAVKVNVCYLYLIVDTFRMFSI
jgi:repressor of nif and glnA expression